jgi:hypothetical protein
VYVGVMPMKTDTTPAGCYPYPNYRFEGWLLKSGFDPYEGIIRVRGLLMSEGTSSEAMGAQLAFFPPAFQGYRDAR